MQAPKTGHCYRFIGDGPANGVLQRVVLADAHEVVAVQEVLTPRFAWLGTPSQFWEQFVFIVGPAPSAHRRI